MKRILMLAAVIACPTGWFGAAWIAEREFTAVVQVRNAGPRWSFDWRASATGESNGVWIDLTEHIRGDESLEIRPIADEQASPPAPFEFWLYRAIPRQTGAAESDLKAAIAAGLEGWVPFQQGPGIVCVKSDARPLRIRVPAGGISLEVARTDYGGKIEAEYAGEVRPFDARSRVGVEHTTIDFVPSRVGQLDDWRIARRLPTYDVSSVGLRWYDSPDAEIRVTQPRVVTRVFGISVRNEVLGRPEMIAGELPAASEPTASNAAVEKTAPVDQSENSAVESRTFRATAAGGELRWALGRPFTTGVRAACAGGSILVAAALVLLAALIGRIAALLVIQPRLAAGMAVGLVIMTHAWVASWAPLFVAPDSTDYLRNAAELLRTHSLEHFDYWHPPGFSIFLAPFLKLFTGFAPPLGWMQATFGVVTALLAWRVAVRVMPQPCPILTLLYVGLSPITLTYERWVLTESFAGLLVTLCWWLAVRDCVPPGQAAAAPAKADLRAWGAAVGLGILCGLAPYVRPNLQLLCALIPPACIFGRFSRRRRPARLALGAVVALVAAACIVPWYVRNQTKYGRAEFALGRGFTRALSGYNSGVMDPNQSGYFPFDQWKDIRRRMDAGTLGDFPFLGEIGKAPWRPAADKARQLSPPVLANEQCEQVFRESVARDPAAALRAAAVAFTTQLGLWTKYRHPTAQENVHWSAALRGVDVGERYNWSDMFSKDEGLADLIARSRTDITYLRGSTEASWFNELFWTWRFVRPLAAVLFLIGFAIAVRERCVPVVAAGLIVLVNSLALSILLLSALDRYAAPFEPLMGVTAAYGLCGLLRAAARLRSADPVPVAVQRALP